MLMLREDPRSLPSPPKEIFIFLVGHARPYKGVLDMGTYSLSVEDWYDVAADDEWPNWMWLPLDQILWNRGWPATGSLYESVLIKTTAGYHIGSYFKDEDSGRNSVHCSTLDRFESEWPPTWEHVVLTWRTAK